MNNYTLLLITSFVLITSTWASGSPESETIAQKYLNSFETNDSLARAVALRDFDSQVALFIKADVLADLLSTQEKDVKAKTEVVCSVLSYLGSEPAKNLTWNKRLKAAVLSQRNNKSRDVRTLVINLVGQLDPEMIDDTIRYYLNDEDENLRMTALDAAAKRPNGKADIQAYIVTNKSSPAHESSIKRAQELSKGAQ